MGLLFRHHDEQPDNGADDRFRSITQGVPGRCPECDGFGYIDHLDLVYRTQVQHCRDCGYRWEYRFDEAGALIEMRDLRTPGARAQKVVIVDPADEHPAAEAVQAVPAEVVPAVPDEPVLAEAPVVRPEPLSRDEVLDLTDDAPSPVDEAPAEEPEPDDDVLDLTDEAAEPEAVEPEAVEPEAAQSEAAEPTAEATEPAVDDVYAKTPGEWLRDSIRR